MPCNAGYDWCKDKEVVHKDGDMEYCVFHATPENKKGFSLDKFNKLVFAEISTGTCNFSGTVFPGDIIFRNFTGQVNFENAEFLASVYFDDVIFRRYVCFDGAIFNNVSFNNTKFEDRADFIRTLFNGRTNFVIAQFWRDTRFSESRFNNVDFGHTAFSNDVDFGGAAFIQASFSAAKFNGVATFNNTSFKKQADFDNAEFKKADFYGHTFEARANFKHITVKEQIIFQNVNLRQASFRETDIRACKFVTCEFDDSEGRFILFDEKEINEADKTQRKDRIRQVESLYRAQKQKCKENHNEFDYSLWHMSEKEMQWERTTLKNPAEWLVLFLYKFSSGYGEEPKRAFLWLLLLISFAFTFVCFASSSIGVEQMIITIDYLTFRRPEGFSPKGPLGYYINLTSHILVPLQAALFAFALRNRFRR